MQLPPLSPQQRTTIIFDEIITVSVRLDSLEQTLNPLLNPYHGLRRFAVPSHSTSSLAFRPSLHLENVSHVLPSRQLLCRITYRPTRQLRVLCKVLCAHTMILIEVANWRLPIDFKDATYATLTTRAAHTAATPLIS